MDQVSSLKIARNLAIRLLTYRGRSVKEMKDYLERKGFSNAVTSSVISELTDYGYLNDRQFSIDFINARRIRGYGQRRTRFELKNKGISNEVINAEIDRLHDQEEDLEKASALIRRREPKTEQIDQKWLSRQIAFLKRRGFPDQLIMKVISEYKEYPEFEQ